MKEFLETVFENALKRFRTVENKLESFEKAVNEKSKGASSTIEGLQHIESQIEKLSVFVQALQNIFYKRRLVQNLKDSLVKLALDTYTIHILETVHGLERGGVGQTRPALNCKSLIVTGYLVSNGVLSNFRKSV